MRTPVAPPRLPRRDVSTPRQTSRRPSASTPPPAHALAPGGVSSPAQAGPAPPSPRRFIQEGQATPRNSGSALIPVESQGSQASASAKAAKMCHPLFAGWCDSTMFGSLVSQDMARLQRRLMMRAVSDASRTALYGRRDLLDPEACTRHLVAMLLQASESTSLGGEKSNARAERHSKASATTSFCNELTERLAERAARLEVLLGLLAEVMVPHVAENSKSGDGNTVQLADSTACPSTRIGWVDAAILALSAPLVSAPPPPRRTSQAQDVKNDETTRKVQRSVAVQVNTYATPPLQHEMSTQTEAVAPSCAMACQTDSPTIPERTSESTQTVWRTRDATTLTEEVARNIGVDVDVQATPASADAGAQIAVSISVADVQTDSALGPERSDTATQTDDPPTPRPGGIRERKLNAEEASNQLFAMREKLALERQTSAALESRMSEAGRSIAELQRKNAGLQKAAAAAAAAARRPPAAEISTQTWLELQIAEVQTDPVPFLSHSWQSRPSNLDVRVATGTVAVQADVVTASAATQTPALKRPATLDACVGDEEPLRLRIGRDLFSEACWKTQYAEGMRALAQQWQGRFEDSELERQRLQEELATGAASVPGEAAAAGSAESTPAAAKTHARPI